VDTLANLARATAIVLLGATFGLAGAVVATPASAAQQNAAGKLGSAALTAASIEGLIKSYPVVKTSAEALAKKNKVHIDTSSPAARWQSLGAAIGVMSEMNGVVSPYGFRNFQDWLDVTISVATAYAFAKEGDKMDAQLAAAIKEIKKNPDIPDEQKKILLEQMGQGGAIAGMRPSQENIDAVTPYLDQLAALFH
jgi:hypothetical protein